MQIEAKPCWIARFIGTLTSMYWLLILIGHAFSEYPTVVSFEGLIFGLVLLFLILSVITAWKNEKIGGLLLIIGALMLGAFVYITAGVNKEIAVLITTIPFLLTGILFLSNWCKKRNVKFTRTKLFFIAFIVAVLIFSFTAAFVKTASFSVKINEHYKNAVTLGGEWFLNNQNDNFIYYQYNFKDKQHSKSQHSLREMGSLWSITKLADFLEDERYDQLSEKGFSYFENYFVEDNTNNFIYVNITPSKIKLGYSAFAILSLLELEHPDKNELLEKLANGILYQQQEDGSLKTFFYIDRSSGIDYYPGEALLSLMSLYEYNGDKRYLEAVEKALPFYKNYFEENKNTALPPWQSRTYTKFYFATDNDKAKQSAKEFIFDMNDYMIEANYPQQECSDFKFPQGITVAVWMEGVIQAYLIAEDAGDTVRMNCYKNYIVEGSKHITDLIISDTDDKFALGGFKGNKNSSTMRVDRNQHAVMALMDALTLNLI